MKPTLIILPFLLLVTSLFSQKENNTWCFGTFAGLDFSTDPPTPIECAMYGNEGVSSISDKDGNLLFYSNGMEVWNRQHVVMPNGTGLLGGTSSSQAVLIVPSLSDTTQYYLFVTEDQFTDGGLYYSIIDMDLDGGLGDVVPGTHNTLVVDKINEQVSAVLHCNGFDQWIVTHKNGSDEFLSYLFTIDGLSSTPVSSKVGTVYPDHMNPGMLRVSHAGLKLACSFTYDTIAELFDFDPATGRVSNPFDLQALVSDDPHIYGMEFSPDDRYFYFAGTEVYNYLFQLDLATYQVTLLTSKIETPHYGALQLAPDQKIYMARAGATFVDVIHQPNQPGFACQYEEEAVALLSHTSSAYGLPNLIPHRLSPGAVPELDLGTDTLLCEGDTLLIDGSVYESGFATYKWNNGATSPLLKVTLPGIYWLEAMLPCDTLTDTIEVAFYSCEAIIAYSLDSCTSYTNNGTNMDYSEFIPAYTNELSCANYTGSIVYRDPPQMNKHSCTPGINGSEAMCISSYNSCTYAPGLDEALLFEVTLVPDPDSAVRFVQLDFYERAPLNYNWIDGPTGLNNYPRKFTIRILKNGLEIFRRFLNTSNEWTFHSLDFSLDDDFITNDTAVFQVEMLPYCLVGNDVDVAAWDIDEIRVYGQCLHDMKPIIFGEVYSGAAEPMQDVEMRLSPGSNFDIYRKGSTGFSGEYLFYNLTQNQPYYISAYKNDRLLQDVNTLDLVYLHRYLLGLYHFTSLAQYVAADINHSGTIDVWDLLELRKALLGISQNFANNTSWRFGLKHQAWESNLLSDFVEVGTIEHLGETDVEFDFIGIKVGDVIGNFGD